MVLLFSYSLNVMRSLFGILNWSTLLKCMNIHYVDMFDLDVGTWIMWLCVWGSMVHLKHAAMLWDWNFPQFWLLTCLSFFLWILFLARFCCSPRYEEQLRRVYLLVKERLIFCHVFPSTLPTNQEWPGFSGFEEVY